MMNPSASGGLQVFKFVVDAALFPEVERMRER